MSQEIERKFLLRTLPPQLERAKGVPVAQGYLAIEPGGLQVRLRKKGETPWLTVKRGEGMVREEHEVELASAQFEALWPLTEGRRLTKTRHVIPYGDLRIEVDIYTGANQGVVVAEVEFESEEAARSFIPPDWFAEDVSDRPEYSNRNLARE